MDVAMTGGLLAAIGSMATTTKTIIETVRSARTKAKSPEVVGSLSEALEHIISLQAGMINLQEKVLGIQNVLVQMQNENTSLREKIRQEEKRAKDGSQYKRKKIGNAVVLFREEEPEIVYCPACFETKGQSIPLATLDRSNMGFFGTYKCPSCKAIT